jgi:hypothetical protein
MVVKTFRGMLADGGQDRIKLSTIKGKVGYRIIKFQVMPNNLNSSGEACMKIFKSEQSSATFLFDFTDTDLLAAAYYTVNVSADSYPEDHHVIFDNQIVNQDIYITHKNNDNVSMNYYIELEVIPLDDKGAEYTTVKDLRTRGF